MVKNCGRTVNLETEKTLLAFLNNFPGVDEMIIKNSDEKNPPEFDLCIFLLSLPRIYGTELESVPVTVPYLHAASQKVSYWRNKPRGDGVNVGVAWAGNPEKKDDHKRS